MRFAIVLALVGAVAAADPPRAPTRQAGVVALLIDQSGSMRDRLDAVKVAAKAVQQAMFSDDTIVVVGFNHEPTFYVRPQRAANTARIQADIDRMAASGGTDLLPALKEITAVMSNTRANRKHVIVVTDGEFDESGLSPALAQLRRAKVTVSSVGIGDASNEQMERVASSGSGRSYRVDDLAKLTPVLLKDLETAQLKRPTTADASKPHRHRKAIALLIDRSWSMNGEKLDAEKAAVEAVRDGMDDADILSVLAFNDEPPIVLSPVKVASSGQLIRDVDRIGARGRRALLPAVKRVAEELRAVKVASKHVIVVTGGEFDASGIVEVIEGMRRDDVTMSLVGLPGSDRNALAKLAVAGNGRLYLVEEARSLSSVLVKESRDASLARN